MFNYLYKKYRVDILKTNFGFSIKELKLYEKIGLVMFLGGAIFTAVCTFLLKYIWTYVTVLIMITGFVVLLVFRSRKSEQQRIIKDVIAPSAKERMEKIVNLLLEFGIDISDDEQLDNLIERAKKMQNSYDVSKGFRDIFKGGAKYIILPIVTIFFAEFLKDVPVEKLLLRAVVLILVSLCIVLVVAAFANEINEILNPDIRDLEYFIRDIEDVKTFSKKAEIVAEKC